MRSLRIATRASELALWQARHVAELIERALGIRAELVPLETTGDRLQGASLAKIGGKGLFVKEIEAALLDKRADLAVHSAKDLPAIVLAELPLIAFPERADPRDALICRDPTMKFSDLPRGARIGTGSVRRTAQLLRERPDFEVVPLRGNVQTRLSKLESLGLDAVVLACAGLDRLGWGERITERIEPERLLPAVAQGAIAVQVRRDDPFASDLSALDHAASARRIAAERSFLVTLAGDCNVPLAALAEQDAVGLRVRGLVISPDGSREVRAERTGALDDAERMGCEIAEEVLRNGGAEVLEWARSGAGE